MSANRTGLCAALFSIAHAMLLDSGVFSQSCIATAPCWWPLRDTRPPHVIDSITELYRFTLSHYGVPALCPTLTFDAPRTPYRRLAGPYRVGVFRDSRSFTREISIRPNRNLLPMNLAYQKTGKKSTGKLSSRKVFFKKSLPDAV